VADFEQFMARVPVKFRVEFWAKLQAKLQSMVIAAF
jgi:hypothetical protein